MQGWQPSTSITCACGHNATQRPRYNHSSTMNDSEELKDCSIAWEEFLRKTDTATSPSDGFDVNARHELAESMWDASTTDTDTGALPMPRLTRLDHGMNDGNIMPNYFAPFAPEPATCSTAARPDANQITLPVPLLFGDVCHRSDEIPTHEFDPEIRPFLPFSLDFSQVVQPGQPFDLLEQEDYTAGSNVSVAGDTDMGSSSSSISSNAFDVDTLLDTEVVLESTNLTHGLPGSTGTTTLDVINGSNSLDNGGPRVWLQYFTLFLEIQGIGSDVCYDYVEDLEDAGQYKAPDILVLIILICALDAVVSVIASSGLRQRFFTVSSTFATGKASAESQSTIVNRLYTSDSLPHGPNQGQAQREADSDYAQAASQQAFQSWFGTSAIQSRLISEDTDTLGFALDSDSDSHTSEVGLYVSDTAILQSKAARVTGGTTSHENYNEMTTTTNNTAMGTSTGARSESENRSEVTLTASIDMRSGSLFDVPSHSYGASMSLSLASMVLAAMRLFMACMCVDVSSHCQFYECAHLTQGSASGYEGSEIESYCEIAEHAAKLLPWLGMAVLGSSMASLVFDIESRLQNHWHSSDC